MSQLVAASDRRHRRRAETMEQLLEVAVQVMAEQGVAGLSLGEVARRMGIRPPSLYVYFDSKNAVYDAIFARGWLDVLVVINEQPEPDESADLPTVLLESATAFVRWHLEHPVHAQLMGWRPVPGYEPSEQAYRPAVAVIDRGRELLSRLQALGLFHRDVPVAELLNAWTVLISGVITQQLANAPQQPFEQGTFTRLLPQLVAMYHAHYSSRTTELTKPTEPTKPQGRGGHAHHR